MVDVFRLLNRSELAAAEDDMLRTASAVRVFRIGESRHEWDTLPNERWAVAWALSLEEAKRQVESLRRRGSAWRIRECAGGALVGDRRSLILVGLFRGALASITPRPLPVALRAFSDLLTLDRMRNGLVLLTTAATEFPRAAAPWSKYDSVPQGPDWPLHWVPSATTEDLADVSALVRMLNAGLLT